jgi:protoporphyrinogen oxidase
MLRHERVAEIYLNGVWVLYPFQSNLNHLPPEIAYECIVGAVEATQAPKSERPENFAAWLLETFGQGLVRHCFAPYNQKLWTVELERMSHAWVSERIAHRGIKQGS